MVLTPSVGRSLPDAREFPNSAPLKVLHVVGARPNFPKLAPVYRAAASAGVVQIIVHTGQHYDDALSDALFRDLGIPQPDENLAVGSASHAVQTARIMEGLEPAFLAHAPDWVLVYGDVNSTVAAALVAAKLGVRVAHVEAGLRSHDRSMPEEINRLVTDRLSDLLLTPSRDADQALRREGEAESKIVFVGNVMIDSLFYALARQRESNGSTSLQDATGAVVVTLHRPSNVDEPVRLGAIAAALREIARERRVIFPAHPRTVARLRAWDISLDGVQVLEPLSYGVMAALVERSHVVITDSGGLQEETTALGVPCLTVRENTERPVTITEGTNTLVPDPAALPAFVRSASRPLTRHQCEGWDGCAGTRIVEALMARGA